MIQRRRLLASAGFAASMLAAPAIVRAQGKTVKMGALRLVHSMPPYFYEKFAPAGTKIEIIVFDSPTDGKNAVVTKSVDFDLEFLGEGASMQEGKTVVAFSASATIDRRDFGVSFNHSLLDGSVVVGNKVVIEIETEAALAE